MRQACGATLAQLGLGRLQVAVVYGDDVLPIIKERADDQFAHLETQAPIASVRSRLTTANAYIGADGVAAALRTEADIVLTGRVADPSLYRRRLYCPLRLVAG